MVDRKIGARSQNHYLRGREITAPIPPTICYHSGIRHANTGLNLPCLVAAACNVERMVTGIQRIYLTHDGRRAPLHRDALPVVGR